MNVVERKSGGGISAGGGISSGYVIFGKLLFLENYFVIMFLLGSPLLFTGMCFNFRITSGPLAGLIGR